MAYAIGSDPEVFVSDQEGKVVPVIGLVGGTKEKPLDLGDGYAVQEDGVALEYNIPPCFTVQAFVEAVEHGHKLAKAKLPQGYGTIIKPDHEFRPEQLEDPIAWVSGCDPDYSAWTMQKRSSLDYREANNRFARYCGGHIHLSYDNPDELNPMTKIYMTRVMDMLTGVPSRLIEGDSIRSQQFGTFGIYRPKPYGLEYRTMSNVWMTNPVLMRWVARSALFVAAQAHVMQRMHDLLYRDDIGTFVPDELENFCIPDKETLSNWIENVRMTGVDVQEDLCELLYNVLEKRVK